jgi:hypothetical protein
MAARRTGLKPQPGNAVFPLRQPLGNPGHVGNGAGLKPCVSTADLRTTLDQHDSESAVAG